ncbi:AAA family ATPase [Mitsuaria sp. GD03876]|uniref:AAA family ATPase n=1 Tax=Mitsuaria sp. GD03876 TaxID=2975399 RepID=UPI00244A60B5|nr:AAA family ATPase [Mitsuaria sp. GD03876]MDH0866616.1 helicase RepA family protein [Mitsuaria sp. GD03876]
MLEQDAGETTDRSSWQAECGVAAKAMRQGGLANAHPGHLVLRELVKAGVKAEDFELIALEAVTKGKGFAWALAALKGRREDAARVPMHTRSKRDHEAELREWAPHICDARFSDVADAAAEVAADSSVIPMRLDDWMPRCLPPPDSSVIEAVQPSRPTRPKRSTHASMQDGSSASPRELNLVRAAEISTAPALYTDELIERVFGRKAMSCLYGPSNAGKSYVALDMACAVALGVPWMGRKTRRGLVLYLATEGGSSICDRIKAYRIERGEALGLLMIVPDAVDLRNETSAAELMEVIARAERVSGEKVALIVADTLAAMTPGADENSGKDMGPVIRRAAEIVNKTGAHWLWISHTGKNSERGLRGWSGTYCALDSAIELNDKQVLTVEKQRDLPGKSDRYSFELKPVHIGRTDFGVERFACVVVPKGAPPRIGGKLIATPAAIAITQLLNVRGEGLIRAEIVRALLGQPGMSEPNLFKTIKRMIDSGQLAESGELIVLSASSAAGIS